MSGEETSENTRPFPSFCRDVRPARGVTRGYGVALGRHSSGRPWWPRERRASQVQPVGRVDQRPQGLQPYGSALDRVVVEPHIGTGRGDVVTTERGVPVPDVPWCGCRPWLGPRPEVDDAPFPLRPPGAAMPTSGGKQQAQHPCQGTVDSLTHTWFSSFEDVRRSPGQIDSRSARRGAAPPSGGPPASMRPFTDPDGPLSPALRRTGRLRGGSIRVGQKPRGARPRSLDRTDPARLDAIADPPDQGSGLGAQGSEEVAAVGPAQPTQQLHDGAHAQSPHRLCALTSATAALIASDCSAGTRCSGRASHSTPPLSGRSW